MFNLIFEFIKNNFFVLVVVLCSVFIITQTKAHTKKVENLRNEINYEMFIRSIK